MVKATKKVGVTRVTPNKETTTVAKDTKPGTTDDAATKEKKEPKRKEHPLVGKSDPKVYPFSELPGDFDFDAHKPLRKKDFAHEWDYYLYRASFFDWNAARMRKTAEEVKEHGGTKERQAAKRLKAMSSKIAELRQKLEAQGINVDELLAGDE